jgi:D-sedoheptulose 7-phosphate isomerase
MEDPIDRDIEFFERRDDRRRLGQMLLDYGILSPEQLQFGLRKHHETGKFLGETLVETGLIRRKVWLETLSLQLGIPSIDLRDFRPKEHVIRAIPEEVSRSYTAIAVGQNGNELAMAMRFPQNVALVREIQNRTRVSILPVIGWAGDIERWLDEVYKPKSNQEHSVPDSSSSGGPFRLERAIDLELSPLDSHARLYLDGLKKAIDSIPIEVVGRIIDILIQAYHEGRNVYIMGNGGSAATSSHFACDLGKSTAIDGKKRFRVVSLADNAPLLTAWSNDTHYDDVFVEQLRNLLRAGDVVIGISSSGESTNVIRAVEFARSAGAITISLTGFSGGRIRRVAEVCLVVPSFSVQHIEDAHHALHHLITMHLRSLLKREAAGLC